MNNYLPLLEDHIKALREVAIQLRAKNETFSDKCAKEVEEKADREEVYLILRKNNY